MRKSIATVTVAIFILATILSVRVYAAPSLTLAWDPPAFTIANNNCAEQGTDLTAEDLTRITYELSYRVAGTSAWTKIITQTTTLTVSNLAWATNYDFVVGARFANGVVMCLTDPIQYQTPPEPAPGKCSNLRVLEQ